MYVFNIDLYLLRNTLKLSFQINTLDPNFSLEKITKEC